MKTASLIILLMIFSNGRFAVIKADENSVVRSKTGAVPFASSNLPIVVIDTHGQKIVDNYKITADMGIIYNGEGIRNNLTDAFNNYNGKIAIEIRGSSSQMFPKKQYAFETQDLTGKDLKVSLLGFPSESDWILFAPYNDKSLMRDFLVYKLANDLGRYASRSKYCEVVLNNEYIGVYVLFEKVKRDANRINIKKLEPTDISGDALTGGYILKIDKNDGENNAGWVSGYFPFPQTTTKVYYQYHYPKADEIVPAQMSYIQTLIFNYETIMMYSSNIADPSTGYPKYLDVDSFVDFVLINELAKNVDAYRLSTYLYKDRDSENPRIFAGPVWDFNLSFGNADYYEGGLTNGWQLEYLTNYQNMYGEGFLTPFWWRKLFDDTQFRNKVYARWQQVRSNVFSVQPIINYIDSLTVLLDESKTRNFEKWPVLGTWVWPNYFVGNSYQEEIAFLKEWIANRIYWLDDNMIGEPSDVVEDKLNSPSNFFLNQNYPNPFNSQTTITYMLPYSSNVSIKIFNILGKEVNTLVNDYQLEGIYEVQWNADGLPSGMYVCHMNSGTFSANKKLIFVK